MFNSLTDGGFEVDLEDAGIEFNVTDSRELVVEGSVSSGIEVVERCDGKLGETGLGSVSESVMDLGVVELEF